MLPRLHVTASTVHLTSQRRVTAGAFLTGFATFPSDSHTTTWLVFKAHYPAPRKYHTSLWSFGLSRKSLSWDLSTTVQPGSAEPSFLLRIFQLALHPALSGLGGDERRTLSQKCSDLSVNKRQEGRTRRGKGEVSQRKWRGGGGQWLEGGHQRSLGGAAGGVVARSQGGLGTVVTECALKHLASRLDFLGSRSTVENKIWV